MTYSDRIDKLDTIRAYARSFCVEGFKYRTDYKEKSPENYNNARRRMENWLGEAFAAVFDEQGKRFHIQLDSRDYSPNPLNAVFRAKTFTNKNIFLCFTLLDLLADKARHKTSELITNAQKCWKLYADEWSLTPDTIRHQLKDFEDLGILCAHKAGRDKYYSISEDEIDRAAWHDALAFYSEAGILSIIGAFLSDKFEVVPEAFTFKHHYIHHILDSEVLLAALEAIAENRRIQAKFLRKEGNEEKKPVWELCPIEIRVSASTGRHWLISLVSDPVTTWRYEAIRLDDILTITIKKDKVDPQTVAKYREHLNAHLWGVTCRDLNCLVKVEMTIRDTSQNSYILLRLERERRCGRVTRVDDFTRHFEAEVCDAEEMAPWLMSFTGYIESLTCSNKAFEKRFWDEVRGLVQLYDEACDSSRG